MSRKNQEQTFVVTKSPSKEAINSITRFMLQMYLDGKIKIPKQERKVVNE